MKAGMMYTELHRMLYLFRRWVGCYCIPLPCCFAHADKQMHPVKNSLGAQIINYMVLPEY